MFLDILFFYRASTSLMTLLRSCDFVYHPVYIFFKDSATRESASVLSIVVVPGPGGNKTKKFGTCVILSTVGKSSHMFRGFLWSSLTHLAI